MIQQSQVIGIAGNHNIQGNSRAEFLKNLQQEQKTQDYCPCFLEAGFIEFGKVYGYLVYLDVVNGGVVTIHEEGIYDMMGAGVEWSSKSEPHTGGIRAGLFLLTDWRTSACH